MEQTPKSIKFVKWVESLIDSGTVKNYAEIIRVLDWNKTVFSSVINGKKNVPNDVYRKFKEVYDVSEIEDIDIEKNSALKIPGLNNLSVELLHEIAKTASTIAEANRVLAESNKTLSDDNHTLLMAAKPANSGIQPHISEVLEPYLQLFAKSLANKSLKGESDVLATLNSLLTDSLRVGKESGKHA